MPSTSPYRVWGPYPAYSTGRVWGQGDGRTLLTPGRIEEWGNRRGQFFAEWLFVRYWFWPDETYEWIPVESEEGHPLPAPPPPEPTATAGYWQAGRCQVAQGPTAMLAAPTQVAQEPTAMLAAPTQVAQEPTATLAAPTGSGTPWQVADPIAWTWVQPEGGQPQQQVAPPPPQDWWANVTQR